MLEVIFAFLFKYRPVVFEHGELVLTPPWAAWAAPLVTLAAMALAVVPYLRVSGDLGRRDRIILATLRAGVLALLLFCLARPVLVVATVVPQQNFLGVLLDDSRSMQIADQDRPRSAVETELFAPESALAGQLAERFQLRLFRFSETVERVAGTAELGFQGRRTDLAQALEGARQELGAAPLAGLVLVTDGAENADGPLNETLLALRAAGVPVHVVAVGRERLPRDVEVARVELPRRVLAGSTVAVDVSLAHQGMGGAEVPVQIEDGGRILGLRQATLSDAAEGTTVRLHFTASEPGPRTLRVVVPPQPGELLAQNNAREVLLEVENQRERILYFEGEPRWEVRFLRRAIEDDSNLEVVILQRTAEDKFQRLNVTDSIELAAGFPRTREELFAYRGLILGSVEASAFTHEQLRMIRDFVAQRGGGLLVLGGRLALSQGGFAGTPVADALPVVLEARRQGDTSRFFAEVTVELTPPGRAHPVTQLAPEPRASEERWKTLPRLSILNPITVVKPGATTLLRGRVDGRREPLVVLAFQRYGRGKGLALPVQDTWIWQMHADIPLEDLTHETLWRQLLRWLVSEVPDRLEVTTSADRVEPGRAVAVTALLRDSAYAELNGAELLATVTDPAGNEHRSPLGWVVERDGEYRGSFTPGEEGLYQVRVEARRGGVSLAAATTEVAAGDLGDEYFGAGMRRPLLQRIAEETGGRFYTAGSVHTLPEDVSLTESGATVREERSLWDMPAVFLLLLILVGAEWGYRRRRGLK